MVTFRYLRSTYALRISPASCYDFAFLLQISSNSLRFLLASVFYPSFKTKNVSSFLLNDLYSYIKTSFKKVFHWLASSNSVQRRSGYSSMGSIKSIKNLIRSETFQSLSLNVLSFAEVFQGHCRVFRG